LQFEVSFFVSKQPKIRSSTINKSRHPCVQRFIPTPALILKVKVVLQEYHKFAFDTKHSSD